MLTLDRLTRLSNFGRSVHSLAYLFRPTRPEQIGELLQLAARREMSVALRGSGRSYGDAALNGGQVVLDLRRMNRLLDWNPETGEARVEPGVTIQRLWEYTLEDGYWPAVVPGTMHTTLGGALAMNIHGKNNWKAGTLGEHVVEFTALLPTGELVTCSPRQNADLFHGLIGGAGLLGVFTSISLKLNRIYSGDLRVSAWSTGNLREMAADVDHLKAEHDYIVGWVDGTAAGGGLGRGQIHGADYLRRGDDPHPEQSLRLDHQHLPDTFFGVLPKSSMWFAMQFFMNNFGTRLINTGKYYYSRLREHRTQSLQSLVAFNFLLDYVPNWERSYGQGGLIQYQSFVPRDAATDTFNAMLARSQRRGLPTYLGVLKRHRPDKFLLSHAVDGFSLAMDFRVTRGNRAALQALADELNQMVLEAGGRFYFAKDSTLTADAAARSLGADTLRRFHALKRRCDPQAVLQTELYRRLLRAEAPEPRPASARPEASPAA